MPNLVLAAAAAASKIAAPATAAAAKAAGSAARTPVNRLAPAQQPVQAPAPQHLTWFQMHAGWLTHTIAGLFLISAIALIALLAAQTTKQEGLSGTIGGRVESAYGRPGMDEQLKRITGFTATCFVIFGTILALTGI